LREQQSVELRNRKNTERILKKGRILQYPNRKDTEKRHCTLHKKDFKKKEPHIRKE